jgi:hypothetical protein
LEKLGFPWILSSEMSLFNGLWANFAENFIRALLLSHAGQGAPNKLFFPRPGTTGFEATFQPSIASGNNTTITYISEFGNANQRKSVLTAGDEGVALCEESLDETLAALAQRLGGPNGRLFVFVEIGDVLDHREQKRVARVIAFRASQSRGASTGPDRPG